MIAALDDPEDRVLWSVAFHAGLRRGELVGLHREDIDLQAGVIHVRRGWDFVERDEIEPKSRHGRRKVPIAAVLRRVLAEHLLSQQGETVFTNPAKVARANDRAKECWQAAGLPVIVLHEARHVFASFAIAAGVNAKALSTFMGHGSIQITYDLYGHLLPGSEDEAAGLLDAYFGHTVAQTVAHPAQTAV
jgi:integrase